MYLYCTKNILSLSYVPNCTQIQMQNNTWSINAIINRWFQKQKKYQAKMLTCSANTTRALNVGAISKINPELFQKLVMSPSLPVQKKIGPSSAGIHHSSKTHHLQFQIYHYGQNHNRSKAINLAKSSQVFKSRLVAHNLQLHANSHLSCKIYI